ncbi:MAG: hypothetical protein C4523_18590 [Myxococcales bacterium]|nr:MAG: hypothetical protein C4523_18590 [Myxococcales bacterium]
MSFSSARRLVVRLCLVLFGILLPTAAQAYTLIECSPRWSSQRMPVPWMLNTACSADLGFNTCFTALNDSFDAWTDVDCATMEWTYGGTSSLDPDDWGVSDGTNLMVWEEGSWPRDLDGAIAVTAPIFYGCDPGSFLDTDILFNGVDYTWGVDGSYWKMDVANIATHEIGHAVGLDHSDVWGATMYYATSPGVTDNRSLHRDDINGVCAIYPLGADVKIGDPCDENCEANEDYYCVEADGESYCTRDCDQDNDCGAKYICTNVPGHALACWTPGDLGFGKACAKDRECDRGLECLEGLCTYLCPRNCPVGYLCQEVSQGVEACLLKAKVGFGEDCRAAICDGEFFCQEADGESRCASACAGHGDCPDGFYCRRDAESAFCWPGEPPAGAVIERFTGAPEAPVKVGQMVTFAVQTGGGDDVLVRFRVRPPGQDWTELRAWGASSSALWHPESIGTHTIAAQAKLSDSGVEIDDEATLTYRVLPSEAADGDTPLPDGDAYPLPDGDGVDNPFPPADGDLPDGDGSAAVGGGGCAGADAPAAWLLLAALISGAAWRRRGGRNNRASVA